MLKLFLNFKFFAKRYCLFSLLKCKKRFLERGEGGKQISDFFLTRGDGATPGGMEHLIPGVWSTLFLADIICEWPHKKRLYFYNNNNKNGD